VEHLDSWFNTHSHGDAVNGPPDANVGDMATISRRFNPPATAISELVQIPFKPGSRVSFGETDRETSAGSFESTGGFSPAVLSVKTLPVGLKSNGRFQCPDQMFDELNAVRFETQNTLSSSLDALVDAAVRRASSFSPEQVRAFSNVMCARNWVAVDKLSGDQVRHTSPLRTPGVGTLLRGAHNSSFFMSWPTRHVSAARRGRGTTTRA
jgi:hypothetical protein